MPLVINLARQDPERELILVDVEGELEDAAVMRWSGALRGAIEEGATGIAVDLRGCRGVDPICLSVLLAASSMLRAGGGGGVKLVTDAGSTLGRELRTLAAEELPAYPSAAGALRSLREAQ